MTDYSKQTQHQPYLHAQLSYHVPNKHRALYEKLECKDAANHKWDGHTSDDVLNRLMELCKS